MPSGPSRLRALLDPIDPALFLEEHWDRVPVVLPGGPARARALLGPLAEPGAMLAALPALAEDRRVAAWAALPHDRWLAGDAPLRPFLPIAIGDAPLALAGGASVQVNGLELVETGALAPLAELARILLAELGMLGEMGLALTWSPPGARFAPHVDPAGAFVLQVEGRKRYRHGRLPWLDPRSKGHLLDDGRLCFGADLRAVEPVLPEATPPEMIEAELGPGDGLYLAPGTLHETEALTGSLALLFLCMEQDPLSLVQDVLRKALLEAPGWRRLPAGGPGRPGLPGSVRGALASCLAELRALLDAHPAENPLWEHAWNARIARAAGAPPALALDGGPVLLSPDPRVRLSRAPGLATLHLGELELGLEGPWAALVERLAAGPATADELSRELALDPGEVEAALETLAEHGALSPGSPR